MYKTLYNIIILYTHKYAYVFYLYSNAQLNYWYHQTTQVFLKFKLSIKCGATYKVKLPVC